MKIKYFLITFLAFCAPAQAFEFKNPIFNEELHPYPLQVGVKRLYEDRIEDTYYVETEVYPCRLLKNEETFVEYECTTTGTDMNNKPVVHTDIYRYYSVGDSITLKRLYCDVVEITFNTEPIISWSSEITYSVDRKKFGGTCPPNQVLPSNEEIKDEIKHYLHRS